MKSINDYHTYNLTVYIKDEDARIGVLQFLYELGYEFSAGKNYKSFLTNEWRWDYDMVSCNQQIIIKDGYVGIGSNDKEPNDEIVVNDNMIDCGCNKELFKGLAMIRSDRDDNQYYVERGNPNRPDNIKILTQWKHYPDDCNIEWCLQYVKKATFEDLKEFLT